MLVKENHLPPLASLLAPENCRYHAASKVIGSQILWLTLFGVQAKCGSRRGRSSDQITSKLSSSGTGQRLIRPHTTPASSAKM